MACVLLLRRVARATAFCNTVRVHHATTAAVSSVATMHWQLPCTMRFATTTTATTASSSASTRRPTNHHNHATATPLNRAWSAWNAATKQRSTPSDKLCTQVLRACAHSTHASATKLASLVWANYTRRRPDTTSSPPQPSTAMCTATLQVCAATLPAAATGEQQLQLALSVWQWMLQHSLPPTPAIAEQLLYVCANTSVRRCHRGSDVNTAWAVWRAVRQAGQASITTTLANSLMQACARGREPAHNSAADAAGAQRLWHWMLAKGLPPDTATCNWRLSACADSRLADHGYGSDVGGAWEVWEWMQAEDMTPAASHCTHMLRACACARDETQAGGSDVAGMKEVWQYMMDARIPLTATAYRFALKAFCDAKHEGEGGGADLHGALGVWEAMQASDAQLQLSQRVEAAMLVLEACARSPSGLDVAWSMWQWLVQVTAPHHPQPEAARLVVKACSNAPTASTSRVTTLWRQVTNLRWPVPTSLCRAVIRAAASRRSGTRAEADVVLAEEVWLWASRHRHAVEQGHGMAKDMLDAYAAAQPREGALDTGVAAVAMLLWMHGALSFDRASDVPRAKVLEVLQAGTVQAAAPPQLGVEAFTAAVRACGRSGYDATLAMMVFEWATQCNSDSEQGVGGRQERLWQLLCGATAHVCAHSSRDVDGGGSAIVEAWRLWRWSYERGLAPTLPFVDALLRACGNARVGGAEGPCDARGGRLLWGWIEAVGEVDGHLRNTYFGLLDAVEERDGGSGAEEEEEEDEESGDGEGDSDSDGEMYAQKLVAHCDDIVRLHQGE